MLVSMENKSNLAYKTTVFCQTILSWTSVKNHFIYLLHKDHNPGSIKSPDCFCPEPTHTIKQESEISYGNISSLLVRVPPTSASGLIPLFHHMTKVPD